MSIYLGKRYEVLTKIGAGGMADVYKGKDHMLNRYVAIKVLKKEFREDETFVKKFRSEAQAASGLLNPNIVNVYDVLLFFEKFDSESCPANFPIYFVTKLLIF